MIGLLPNCLLHLRDARGCSNDPHRGLSRTRGAGDGRHARPGRTSGCSPTPASSTAFSARDGNRERSEAFVRSVPGIGPPDQSMWSDDEIRTYVALEAAILRRARRRRVAVVGWTLTALLVDPHRRDPTRGRARRVCSLPPLLERGPAPPVSIRRSSTSTCTPAASTVWPTSWASKGCPSFPALLLGPTLTLVTEVPEVLGITAAEVESWVPTGRLGRYRPGHPYALPPVRCSPTSMRRSPTTWRRSSARPGPVIYVAITSSPPDLVAPCCREPGAARRPRARGRHRARPRRPGRTGRLRRRRAAQLTR